MYILNILVPFNVLIDTDMGLIKLIRFEYRNDSYFYPGILKAPDNCLQYVLMTRENRNPLSVAFIPREDGQEIMDSFYEQFMEREYEKIVNLSCCTSVVDILAIANMDRDKVVRFTILCESEFEKETIISRKIPYHSIIVSKPDSVNLNKFQGLYVKDYTDLDKYKNISGKSIYIPNYRFNITIDENLPDPILPLDLVAKYSSDNEINVFTIYALNPKDIPVG